MTKALYVGVDEIARKVNKIYVGVDDFARKVKKAYVGVGGVARPFFSSEVKIEYYGTIENLSKANTPAVSQTKNHAIFVVEDADFIDAYGKDLIKIPIDNDLTIYNFTSGKGYNDNYAILAGTHSEKTEYGWSVYMAAYAFTEELTKIFIQASGMVPNSYGCYHGRYAVFGGGQEEGTTLIEMVAFDENLTEIKMSDLDYGGIGCRASSNSNYVLFAGGWYGNYITAYDKNLVKTDVATQTQIGDFAGTTFAGDNRQYAIFAGGSVMREDDGRGWDYVDSYSEVYVYDANLIRYIATPLDSKTSYLDGTTLEGVAIFAGGYSVETYVGDGETYAYDKELVRIFCPTFSVPREAAVFATVGSFAIFAGGYEVLNNGDSQASSLVEAFTIV